MARNEAEHRQLVESFLAKMQDQLHRAAQRFVSCEMLLKGISGASIYRVHLTSGHAVLKLTLPLNGHTALERARRELGFYRQLTGRIALRVPDLLAAYDGPEGVA